jgi:hypothetical protein
LPAPVSRTERLVRSNSWAPTVGFERLDRLAQRRLADVQALGGAREVQLLGDGDEVAQVA